MARSGSRRGVYLLCRVLPGTGAAAREGEGTRVGGEVSGVIARVGRDRVQEEVMWKNEMFKGIGVLLCSRERKWSAMKEGNGEIIRRE